ncbi:hypothetical protein EIP86_006038 [Pleurotus ostreatoroseus]|nr:hypothetical protein EIP86_006038 [Pleurotus ostreatoroseus]
MNQWAGSTPTWFDIDYMLVTSGDGNLSTPSNDVVLDDGHKNITYSSGWVNTPNGLTQQYFNDTLHVTPTQGASASIAFYGNAITVYGATSTNHGAFSIALDGISIPSILNGSAPAFRPQNMLVSSILIRLSALLIKYMQYYSGGLSTTLHTLTITNVDPTGLYLDLDKVVVSTWPVADSSATNGSTSVPQSSSAAAPHGTPETASLATKYVDF